MCFELRKADEKDFLFSQLDVQAAGQLLHSGAIQSVDEASGSRVSNNTLKDNVVVG